MTNNSTDPVMFSDNYFPQTLICHQCPSCFMLLYSQQVPNVVSEGGHHLLLKNNTSGTSGEESAFRKAGLSSQKIEGELNMFSFLLCFQHVHVHILPRKAGDFHRNDSIYDEVSPSFVTLLFDHRTCHCDEINPVNQMPPQTLYST